MCPVRTEPFYKDDGSLWYRTPRKGEPGGHVELPSGDVVHLKTLGYDGVKGLSILSLAARTLGLAVSQEVHQSSLMENQSVPQGYLRIPGSVSAPVQARTLADWKTMHQGPTKSGTPGVLTGGMEWVATSFSPADTELLLSRTFSIADIARFFKVPKHKVGILDEATYKNMEESNRDFYSSSLHPRLTQWEQELSLKLMGPVERKTYFVKHAFGSFLKGNVEAQTAQDTADLQNGIKSINEVRVSRGEEPVDVPHANYHFIQANNLTAIETMDATQPTPVAVLDPDDTTQNDPTTQATPTSTTDTTTTPPPPAGMLTTETLAAMRGVIADPFGRMLHREVQAVKKASKRGLEFAEWQEEFYAGYRGMVTEAIAPGLAALSALVGREIDPGAVADRYVEESREALQGLVVTTPPEELPGAVGRLCSQWVEARVPGIVDSLMGAEHVDRQ